MKTFTKAVMVTSLVMGLTNGVIAHEGHNGAGKVRTLTGTVRKVSGAEVKSWATVDGNGAVREVGVTVPVSVIYNPPEKEGDGPCGAIAVNPFPAVVRDTTYFNHFEMQWNPQGHPPHCFMVPHFDFHFYAVPESDVRAIKEMDPDPPAAERLPKGFVYPGKDTFIPEMGVHTIDPAEMMKPFSAVMIGGFNKGEMHFIEPMITQQFLQRRQSFTMPVPRPAVLGRKTLYPTKFNGIYDDRAKEYRFVFSDFEPIA